MRTPLVGTLVGALAVLGVSCGSSKTAAKTAAPMGDAPDATNGTGGGSGTGGKAQSGTGGAGGSGTGGQGQPGTGGGGGEKIDATVDHADTGSPAQADGGSDVLEAGPDVNADMTGSDAETIPRCAVAPAELGVRVCVLAADGKLVTMGLEATVTVTSLDDALTMCDPASIELEPAVFRRIAVESAAGTKWTILARIPDLPAAQVSVGQILQMTVTAAPTPAFFRTAINQTVVFSRQGNLVLFASNLGRTATSIGGIGSPWRIPAAKFDLLPNLAAWGLTLSDGGLVCATDVVSCLITNHRMDVAWGGTARSVGAGQTVQIGSLSFSLGGFEEFLSSGGCDGNSRTRMAGFVAGP